MEPKIRQILILVILVCIMATTEARKTYTVKEKIHRGEIKVMRPRVQAYDVQWCMFKDDNNDWCITADQDWKLSVNNEYTYQQSDSQGVKPYYKQYMMYNTTQSLAWTSTFNLPRLYYSSFKVTMPEFTAGVRFEVFYWISEYAFCLNIVNFITPIKVQLLIDNKFEECYKTLIKCMDNWEEWTKVEAEMFETCSLSTGAEFTLYEYNPIVIQLDRYLLGMESYNAAMCWPGFTPFMQVQKYDNNMMYAFNQMYMDFKLFETNYNAVSAIWPTLKSAIDFNSKSFEGPIEREHTWDQLKQMTTNLINL